MTEKIFVDGLTLEIKRSKRRSTVSITVERDGVLIVSAPSDCSQKFIQQTVQDKLFWIYSKLSKKEVLLKRKRVREFITGESFFYLGRPYRFLLVDEYEPTTLLLRNRNFILSRYEQPNSRQHFVDWYMKHSKVWLWRRTHIFTERFDQQPAGIYISNLGHSWGTCDDTGIINFHWQTILLPSSIIDYIIVHELAHLIEQNHSEGFWRIVRRIMPDYQDRKRWLAENGAGYLL